MHDIKLTIVYTYIVNLYFYLQNMQGYSSTWVYLCFKQARYTPNFRNAIIELESNCCGFIGGSCRARRDHGVQVEAAVGTVAGRLGLHHGNAVSSSAVSAIRLLLRR